jgi:flavin reductase (DIM6/NTAB) family NADH-FMN oxidoreductase RutF
MPRKPIKQSFPISDVRRFLEPGPIILISSAYKGESNIMTCGWHMMMDYTRVGCYIWDANHSHDLIRKSKECVINLPTAEMASTVVRIGNCSGRDVDKFAEFKLTKQEGDAVSAPLIGECHANIECRLADSRLIDRYGLFVFDVVSARVARRPKYPKTIHYRGNGEFMVSGAETRKWRKLFRPDMLDDP